MRLIQRRGNIPQTDSGTESTVHDFGAGYASMTGIWHAVAGW